MPSNTIICKVGGKEMEGRVNIRSNWRHTVLDYRIRQLDMSVEMTMVELFSRMVDAAVGVGDWEKVQGMLRKVEKKEDLKTVTNMQARYTAETGKKLEKVKKRMWEDLGKPGTLHLQYVMQLLQVNYLKELEDSLLKESLGKGEEEVEVTDLVKFLVEMILIDRESKELEEVKQIITKWRNRK